MKSFLVRDIVAIRLIPLEGSKVVEEGMGEKERRGTEELKCSRQGGKRKLGRVCKAVLLGSSQQERPDNNET